MVEASEGQSTASWVEALTKGGPPSAGQAEPRRSTAFSPQSRYQVTPTDKMDAGRAPHKKRKRSRRSQAFIEPDEFVMKEGRKRFSAMFEVFAPSPRMGNPQGLQFTTQPVGSLHGLGTSPSSSGLQNGRFKNVVDGPTIKTPKRKGRHRKLIVAKIPPVPDPKG